MAANAPYYQLRGQFTTSTNAPFTSTDVDDDYDLATSLAPHNAALYVDHQISDNHTQGSILEENHNLVELLEAATTAAGQAVDAMDIDSAKRSGQNRGKRKRDASPSHEPGSYQPGENAHEYGPPGPKRVKVDIPTDPQLHASRNNGQGSPELSSATPTSENLLNDARTAGVHSAAALFRRSSAKTTRKYTRPPMSKLFMSLQLTPENFLHLQAQAKSYMLDPAYPDRQSCVGNRGKGDTDMVKLRLFNCVRDFLDDGAGETFFGEHVEKPAEMETMEAARALGEEKASKEKIIWPRDGNKIISLVTPLLRRMVTNERQRMYAIETRKGGRKKEGSAEAAQRDEGQIDYPGGHGQEQQSVYEQSQPFTPTQPPVQIQHSNPTSPLASLPGRIRFSTPGREIRQPNMPPRSSIQLVTGGEPLELQQIEERELPAATDRTYDLRKINIQLVKDGVKLKEFKQIKMPETFPSEYSWAKLASDLKYLLGHAVAVYPALRPDTPSHTLQGMEPEALRGLAVAATEFQNLAGDANNPPADIQLNPQTEDRRDQSSLFADAVRSEATTNLDFDSATLIAPPSIDTLSGRTSRTTNVSVRALPPRSAETSPTGSTDGRAVRSEPSDPSEPRASFENDVSDVVVESLGGDVPQPPPAQGQPQEGDPTTAPFSPTAPSFPSAALSPPSASLPVPVLPKYIVKVMLTTGLTEVRDAEGWDEAKDHVAYALWASGRMSVVVEVF